MAKSISQLTQQKQAYHNARSFVQAIEQHKVVVSGDVDYIGIHIAAVTFLPTANFGSLAEKLARTAGNFGLVWTTATWWFTNGSGDSPILHMKYQALTAHGEIDLERSLYYSDGKAVASHDILGIPKDLQGNDFSRMINMFLYDFYMTNKFSIIKIKAGLDAGGFVWASTGFAATRETDVRTILSDAYTNLPLFEAASRQLIQDLEDDVDEHYDSLDALSPYPIYQWLTFGSREAIEEILKGSKWHGELNLKDRVQTLIFEKYVHKYNQPKYARLMR